MSGWDELVTTALLGTDRRPLSPELGPGWASYDPERATRDPAGVVLDLAASHRALRQAGVRLGRETPAEPGPTERLPLAPNRAQDVMAGLLTKPEPGLINLWLSICAERGLGLATELWPRLAQLASRNTAYDRTALLAVLGPPGGWFLRHNPAWARLAEASGAPAMPPPTDPSAVGDAVRAGASPAQAMELILTCADPLPLPLVTAALRIIAGGMLGPQTRDAARSLSHRIPVDVWTELPAALTTDGLSDTTPATPTPATATSPIVQLSLAVIHRTVQARIEIEDAFRTPTRETTP